MTYSSRQTWYDCFNMTNTQHVDYIVVPCKASRGQPMTRWSTPMDTRPHTPQDAPSLDAYLGKLNPIPLNGRYPDQKRLADWAAGAFDWLYQGDPLAEDAALALRQSGGHGNVADRTQPLATQGDPACAALLADMHDIPDWVDFDLMRRGGAMAQRHFPMLVLALTYGCMPLTFAHPDAAE